MSSIVYDFTQWSEIRVTFKAEAENELSEELFLESKIY